MSYIELKYLPRYFISFAGVVSHLLLFICLIKDPLKCFRNSATYLIANLALSDFIVCTTDLLYVFYGENRATVMYLMSTAMLVSLFSIISIAIDRYVLTVHPFKHRLLLNGRRIAFWIVSLWLVCSCAFIKQLIFGADYPTENIIYNTIYITIASVTFFIYSATYFSLKKRRREISQHQSQVRNQMLQETFLNTIMIVAFVQIFTQIPASIFALINGWMVRDGSVMAEIIYAMYFLNFAMNPFLYMWRLRNYRQTFLFVFCRKIC